MLFIKQVEQALKIIDQSRFQSLIFHFLHITGNKFIGAPGSVVGKDKTSKGTPDGFFLHEDKYVFVECTTQEKIEGRNSFFNKLEKDIVHCFNEQKSNISNDQISLIVLACSEKISVEEDSKLRKKVREYSKSADLLLLNIENIPIEIYGIPGLADHYLGVSLLKGEIYNLPDFLTKTTKGIQPSLINKFLGRETELEKALDLLDGNNVLLLTGNQGVGKSKLAVAVLERFEKKGYFPLVIAPSVIPLADDFTHLFQPKKDYIILFDDANKSPYNLIYLLSYLTRPRLGTIKVIITVRDYARESIDRCFEEANIFQKTLSLKKPEDKEIETIISDVEPWLKSNYLVRKKILDLAKGNLRLALMATRSISSKSQDENYLESPLKMYDRYFEKFKNEAQILSKPLTLQTLAIVSFFGSLNRSDTALQNVLQTEFDIEWGNLWTCILELNENEIIDISGNTIAAVPDQVLSTYTFYKCFIDPDTALLDYGKWIKVFLNEHYSRVAYTLIDTNNNFNYELVRELVLPHLNNVLSGIEDEDLKYKYYELFWFYKDVEALKYLKNWKESLPIENITELDFISTPWNEGRPSNYMEILVNYWEHSTELLASSIQLGTDVVAKQPGRLSEYLHYIKEKFSYQIQDFDNSFYRQTVLLKTLLAENRSEIHRRIAHGTFLRVGKTLLGWSFVGNHSLKGRTFSFVPFDLTFSDALLELRRIILNAAIELFDDNKEQVRYLLNKIAHPGGAIDHTIYLKETDIYSKIIDSKLDNEYYPHCEFVQDMIEKFEKNSFEVPDQWRKFLESEVMKLASVFIPNIEDDDIYHSKEEKLIENFVSGKSADELEIDLTRISNFYSQLGSRDNWKANSNIRVFFKEIGKANKKLSLKSLKMLFDDKFSFEFNGYFINYLLNTKTYSSEELWQVLQISEGKKKNFWSIRFLMAVEESEIISCHLDVLISIFRSFPEQLPIDEFQIFSKYQKMFDEFKSNNLSDEELQNHNIITFLANIIISREGSIVSFFGHKFFETSHGYFINHHYLLEAIYFRFKKDESDFDYKGKILGILLNYNKQFIHDSIINGSIGINYSSKIKLNDFVFDFVWSFDDYQEYIESIILLIFERRTIYAWINDNISALLTVENPTEELQEKQEKFLCHFIEKYYANTEYMEVILYHIYDVNKNDFLKYLKMVLLLNSDPEIITHFNFNRSASYTGSRVPVILRKIEYQEEIIKMIKNLPNTLDYLDHITHLEKNIDYLKADKSFEETRDFIEHYHH